jgi:hypothetical protein
VRCDEGRRSIRFLFDVERGVIRHQARHGTTQNYQIEAKERGYSLRPVDGANAPAPAHDGE